MGFFEIFSTTLAALYGLIPSYGLAIILLTIIVRLLLLPLSIKQAHSMRKQQVLRPEIKKLQTRYKSDKQKLQEELMKLYKEHNANPVSGCLPMVLQMPVFIALWRVLSQPLQYMDHIKDWALVVALNPGVSSVAKATSTNSFLGLRLDCTPGQVVAGEGSLTLRNVACGGGVLDAIPYLLLIGLMAYTTYYQSKQMQQPAAADDAQAKQMQTFTKIMPVIFVVFGFQFPTGVVLYWCVTNLLQILQQRIILSRLGEPDAARPATTKAAGMPTEKPVTAKPAKSSGGSPPSRSRPSGASKPHPSSKKKKKKR